MNFTLEDRMNFTLEDVVNWILAHRKGFAFKDYSPDEIRNEVFHSLNQNLILVADNGTEITGIINAEIDPKVENTLRIRNILISSKNNKEVFSLFVAVFQKRFPGWALAAQRKGKEVFYHRTPRLLKGLTHESSHESSHEL